MPRRGHSAKSSFHHNPNASPHAVRSLDIVFLQDATGSQGAYIQSARQAIHSICNKITTSTTFSQGAIRFGLIAFRDHPPQDSSFVTKNFGFTSHTQIMTKNLASLDASGGGDGPEAQTAALAGALNMPWSDNVVKIVVLITDSPPHGIGEDADGFTQSPDRNDPLSLARQMAERGITLYVIACEPTLSKYKNAVDFYRALTQITGGRLIPLVDANQLGDYIVGSALETIETEKLIDQFENVILEEVYGRGKSIEAVIAALQKELKKKGVKLYTLFVEEIYHASEQAAANVYIWLMAKDVVVARKKVKPVSALRVNMKYFGMGAIPQAYSMALHPINEAQTKRVVMQSLMRSAKVGPEGLLTPSGAYAGNAPPPPPPPPPARDQVHALELGSEGVYESVEEVPAREAVGVIVEQDFEARGFEYSAIYEHEEVEVRGVAPVECAEVAPLEYVEEVAPREHVTEGVLYAEEVMPREYVEEGALRLYGEEVPQGSIEEGVVYAEEVAPREYVTEGVLYAGKVASGEHAEEGALRLYEEEVVPREYVEEGVPSAEEPREYVEDGAPRVYKEEMAPREYVVEEGALYAEEVVSREYVTEGILYAREVAPREYVEEGALRLYEEVAPHEYVKERVFYAEEVAPRDYSVGQRRPDGANSVPSELASRKPKPKIEIEAPKLQKVATDRRVEAQSSAEDTALVNTANVNEKVAPLEDADQVVLEGRIAAGQIRLPHLSSFSLGVIICIASIFWFGSR